MTLLLDQKTWDLCLDAQGNIAVAGEPYALAQDAASGIRTFAEECFYDTTYGVPYLSQIFGKVPPSNVFKQAMETEALKVPGIVAAACVIDSFTDRTVIGRINLTDINGNIHTVTF